MRVERMFWYYAIWSDNLHKFGSPNRIPRDTLPGSIKFPDVIFGAKNMADAYLLIFRLNREIRGKTREEFNAREMLEKLRDIGG